MRVLFAVVGGLVVAGCGLSFGIDPMGDGTPTPAPTVPPLPTATGTTPVPQPTGTTPGDLDATPGTDASPVVDAGTDAPIVSADSGTDAGGPSPLKVNVSYALGKDAKMYTFNYDTKTFAVVNSTGCPNGEETAVMEDGTVYATSSDSRNLYRWTAAAGCAAIGTPANLPFALGTAVVAGTERLVGYRDADYDMVDTTTGAVTRLTNNALGGLRPSGDYTRIGAKAYLSVASGSGSCPAGGDCIVEINPADGRPSTAPKQIASTYVYGLAHARGKLLLYVNNTQVHDMDPVTLVLGASLKAFPAGATFSGAGAPALAP